jgi:hypothetical protein
MDPRSKNEIFFSKERQLLFQQTFHKSYVDFQIEKLCHVKGRYFFKNVCHFQIEKIFQKHDINL